MKLQLGIILGLTLSSFACQKGENDDNGDKESKQSNTGTTTSDVTYAEPKDEVELKKGVENGFKAFPQEMTELKTSGATETQLYFAALLLSEGKKVALPLLAELPPFSPK